MPASSKSAVNFRCCHRAKGRRNGNSARMVNAWKFSNSPGFQICPLFGTSVATCKPVTRAVTNKLANQETPAADFETITAACGRLAARRGRLDPIAGSLDRELQTIATGAAEARRLADLAYVAAGGDPKASPYFPLRAMHPTSATRLIAAEARAEQRAHDLAAEIERERRSAMYGRRGLETRQESVE